MSRRNCCCRRDCPIFSDNFDRADNTNVGPDWVEESEDSEIVSNTLQIPAGGSVRTVLTHPTGHQSGVLQATFLGMAVGTSYQLTVNHIDEDNFHFGQLDVEADDSLTYSIGTRSGGSDTILESRTYGPVDLEDMDFENTVRLCRSKEAIWFVDQEGTEEIWACVADNGGRKAGLANPSGGDVEFDDFAWSEHYMTNPTAGCGDCGCECGDYECLSKSLLLTIYAGPDDVICGDCLDGVSFPLEHWRGPAPDGNLVTVWRGESPALPLSPNLGCGGGTRTYPFRLECRPEGYFLCDELSSECNYVPPDGEECEVDGDTGDGAFALPASTCDPLFLVFPMHECEGDGPPICQFYYVVTEAP